MQLRMSALAVAVAATVGLCGGLPASAAPANGAVIGAAASVGQDLQQVQYWHHHHHHYYYRHHYRPWYWGHRHHHHRHWW
jgi:hypothetical protein